MTKESLAALLNGREYLSEITPGEADLAKADRLVVVFGASDDNLEFKGFIDEELSAYQGCTAYVSASGILPEHEDKCECKFCGYKESVRLAHKIEAVWNAGSDGPCWTIRTDIPHATFRINEDGEPFCDGIVFSMDDLGPVAPFVDNSFYWIKDVRGGDSARWEPALFHKAYVSSSGDNISERFEGISGRSTPAVIGPMIEPSAVRP